ncbi:MAG TPA: GNAT family N-acetyltransferase [Gemmataceae bacterium]|jgi:GNAT superfamily N-acetyltransferase|nr:GNAT family N-acetyltransferase [Gemmataceae bacterium]
MTLTIRRGEPRDAAVIVEFNRRMALETEHKALDPEVLARGVERVFTDHAKGFYLVAESGDQIVGQLMVTYEWSDWRDGWFWWMQSVYVREDHRRHGVFRQLYQAMIDYARAAGNVVGIRLYVERDNTRAQATYAQLGMIDPGYLVREVLIECAVRPEGAGQDSPGQRLGGRVTPGG